MGKFESADYSEPPRKTRYNESYRIAINTDAERDSKFETPQNSQLVTLTGNINNLQKWTTKRKKRHEWRFFKKILAEEASVDSVFQAAAQCCIK